MSSVAVSRGRSLDVWQVDPTALFGKFLARYRQQILSVIDAGALFSRDDIAPLIDSALPGLAEVSGLLAVHEAIRSRRYDHIIIDTAPFGHTLRLFELPGHFQRFLSFLELAASRDRVLAAHFGGSQRTPMQEFLNEWQTLAETLRAAFGKAAKLFLVTTPQKFSLNESVRSVAELAKSSPELTVSNVVLNRVVVGRGACAVCSNNSRLTKTAKEFLLREFSGSRLFMGEDPGCPIVGVESLARFGEHVFSGKELNLATRAPKKSTVKFRAVAWPSLDSSLSLVLGKGGVGKTTISAALAVHSRMQHEAAIDICSVDPAPSLDDVFGTAVGDALEPVLGDPKLRACEMDAISLFRRWVSELRANIEDATTSEVSGIHVDLSFERQLLSALLEIVPPGVDEVLAIFRIMDLLSRPRERVLIDMAPTGHALELLRMPERILAWTRPLLKTLAAHRTLAVARDAAVKVAQIGQRARELLSILGSPSAAKVFVVMLAEPLPDHETERLMQDLQHLSLSPKALFVNRVLFAEDVGKCRRCRRAMNWQHSTLMKLQQRSPADTIYIVRNFPSEIIGKSALRALTGELWQLA